MKLILIRHGETTGNSALRYWGMTDITLSEEGVAQAQRLSKRLAGETVQAVYCSELKRAVQTAEEIIRSRKLDIIKCQELNEVNFGELEGLSAEEIDAHYPGFYEQWLKWDPGMSFPGGESVAAFEKRVAGFVTRLAGYNENDSIIVVAHAGTLRMLICKLLALPISYWRKLRLELASISTLEVTPPGAILTSLNDTAHLK